MRGALAEIDLSALTHNLSTIRSLVGHRKILAMIKSDGYGHGAVRVAQMLQEADGFGVAALDEAIMLRHAGIFQPIVVMSQFTQSQELKYINEFHLSVVIHHPYQIKLLEEFNLKTRVKHPISIWLKIDSGMCRLGFQPEEVKTAWQSLQNLSCIKKPFGLMTHFASADLKDDAFTLRQNDQFQQAIANLPGERSICNSAGILHYRQFAEDWVRPGLILYGVSPFADCVGTDLNLRPAMTLRSRLIAIKKVQTEDRVGYGGRYCCPETMPIGMVGIGYGDGYPVSAQNGTPVLINGVICPIIGRVSMDMLTVDLRPCSDAKIGDPVILWGQGLPIEYISRAANTISYELLCHMGERVRFLEINSLT